MQRLVLVAMVLIGVIFCEFGIRALHDESLSLSDSWRRFLGRALRLATLIFAAGMVSNLLGRTRLAAVVVTGETDTIATAAILWVVGIILHSAVRVALLTGGARRLGIAPTHSDAVRKHLFRVIDFACVVVWVVFTLKAFQLFTPLSSAAKRALQAELSVGEFSITLGAVLVFVFILWLSIRVAALVAFVLRELLLPRFQLPQGAPLAISQVSRYTIIFIGIVAATAALGFDLSQMTLVAGGLGVGIGFGLQNVVSNFVAGLILLFERPIRVGDVIEAGGASGTVESLGMRATLVKTFTGAEIVVPNAQLISSEVVNWTLGSDRQRLHIPVQVARGSDLELAVRLLVDVATRHPEIDSVPDPQCYFIEFGESSLDLELRAWTAAGRSTAVGSELRFAINDALSDAGIELPYPQREIHLSSGDRVELVEGADVGEEMES
jgi:small-conductance mechanosensitive channel